MQAILDRMAARMRSLVTRGRVVSTTLNPKRPLIQLTGLAGETKTKIELFVPKGMSVHPTGDEDVILLQVGGSRSHLVALFADDPALRIADLAAGEFGFRDSNGQQIVFRQDRLEITSPKKLRIDVTGDVEIAAQGKLTAQAAHFDLKGNLNVDGDVNATGAVREHV